MYDLLGFLLDFFRAIPSALGTQLTANYIAIAAVIIAGYGLWKQLKKLNQELALQHFSDYTKRYQDIVAQFPENINERDFVLDREHDDYERTMRAMRTYFDLCFEEHYLNSRKFMDEKIWEVWKCGMKTAMSKPAFQQAWKIVEADTVYGKEFDKFIRDLAPPSAPPPLTTDSNENENDNSSTLQEL